MRRRQRGRTKGGGPDGTFKLASVTKSRKKIVTFTVRGVVMTCFITRLKLKLLLLVSLKVPSGGYSYDEREGGRFEDKRDYALSVAIAACC